MSDSDSTSQCCTCKQIKPLTEFHRNKRKPNRRAIRCKACRREWYKANRDKEIARVSEWAEQNKGERKEYLSRYYEANKERWQTYAEQVDPEVNRERARRWARDNPERMRERTRQWAKDNPEKVRVRSSNRRALERSTRGELTGEVVQQMYEDQQGLCAYCEAPLFSRYHIEHMTPISRGGVNDWSNVAIACPECNQAKSAKTAEEFMAVLRGKS